MENRINIPVKKVENMYIDRGMSIRDIAEHFNCSVSTIYRKLTQPKIRYCNKKTKVRVNSILARELMSKHFNRKLHKYEVIHFRDGDTENICIENLYLFPNAAMHAFYHGYINKYDFIDVETYMSTVGKRLKNTYFSASWLYSKYVQEEKSCSAIARDLDISRTTVARKLKSVLIEGQSIFSMRPPSTNQYKVKR